MRPLFISTARAVEANTRLVLRAATGILLLHQQQQQQQQQQPPPSSSSSSSSEEGAGLCVFVHVHDSSRATFLAHAQRLYGAMLTASPMLDVAVIPILNEVGLSRLLPSHQGVEGGEGEQQLYEMACAPLEAQGCGEGSLRLYTKEAMLAERERGFQPLYRYVAVGGTFDHLHPGHKLLLTTAALHASEKLRCGVTGPALLGNKKFATQLQPVEERMKSAERFLRRIRPDLTLELDTIVDVSGGTDRIPDVEALTVSPETEKSLSVINSLRESNGNLKPLKAIPIPYVMTPDGHVVNSTEIRQRLEAAASHSDTGAA